MNKMNNELLSAIGQLMNDRLEPINTGIRELRKDFNGLKQEVVEVKQDIKLLKSDVNTLTNRVISLELTVENDISKKISLLAEGHMENANQIKAMRKDVEVIKEKVDVIYIATEANVQDIKLLQRAK